MWCVGGGVVCMRWCGVEEVVWCVGGGVVCRRWCGV